MIFDSLIIHRDNHDRTRMSSISRVPHATTQDYFSDRLASRFIDSSKVVKEEIMTDINDLVQEFLKTSSDGAVGASIPAMRLLLGILQRCLNSLEVCFNIVSFFVTAAHSADMNLQIPVSRQYDAQSLDNRISLRDKFKILLDGYRKMIDQSFLKFKDLGDMLRLLPGIVVQEHLNMQQMADLYRIEPGLLERLMKYTTVPERIRHTHTFYYTHRYKLDDYLSVFLQDQDRSRLYYCDPMLQHISICRQFLSLLDRSIDCGRQS